MENLEMSLMCTRKGTGPSTVPWGTPDRTGSSRETLPSTTTACSLVLGSRKDDSQHPIFPETPHSFSSWRGPTKRTRVSNCFHRFLKQFEAKIGNLLYLRWLPCRACDYLNSAQHYPRANLRPYLGFK